MTMKPTNFESKSCGDIMSSNCVIWNGPDLKCIGVCHGDSVSKVIYNIANQLCELLEMFDIDAYDLSCLDLQNCPPENFQELIQLLIERICALEGIEAPTPTGGGVNPDEYIMNIAECFYYQNPQGDTETTMTLTQYVTAIGNAFCNHIDTAAVVAEAVVAIDKRVAELENTEKNRESVSIPNITPVCVIDGKDPVPMEDLLSELEKQFCELIGATGNPIQIYEAIAKQCAGLSTQDQLAGPGTMGQIDGWRDPDDAAAAIGNIWLTICDIRAAIQNIQATCCPSGCDGIDLALTASLEPGDIIKLFITGTLSEGFGECDPSGSFVTITDVSGNTIKLQIPIIGGVNNTVGLDIPVGSTPLNLLENLTIKIDTCWQDTQSDTQCQGILNYIITNTVDCPALAITPTQNEISYSYLWINGSATITTTLYDSTGTVVIGQHINVLAGSQTVVNVFTGLDSSTTYMISLSIDVNGTITNCPNQPVTTLGLPCVPPTDVDATLIIAP